MAVLENNFRLVFGLAVIPGVLAVGLLAAGIHEPTRTTQRSQSNRLSWQALQRLGREYWILVGVALLFNLGNSSDAFLLLRASQVGTSAALVPLTLLVMNLAYSLSAYPIGIFSDRFSRIKLLMGGFLLYALVYVGFAFAQVPWQVWGLFACYGLHLGMTQGVLLALVAERVPADLRGTAFGFLNLAVGLALLPASLLGGALW